MENYLIPILTVVGTLCIYGAIRIVIAKDSKIIKTENVIDGIKIPDDYENTNQWHEGQFAELAAPIFIELNNKEFPTNKYWVRYDADLKTREHVVREMYNQTCVWEWRRPIQSVKISNIQILTRLKEGIVNENCRANERLLRDAFADERNVEFHERINKLNPKK